MFHVEHSARLPETERSAGGVRRFFPRGEALPSERHRSLYGFLRGRLRFPRDRERLLAYLTAAAAKLGGDILDKPVRRRNGALKNPSRFPDYII